MWARINIGTESKNNKKILKNIKKSIKFVKVGFRYSDLGIFFFFTKQFELES